MKRNNLLVGWAAFTAGMLLLGTMQYASAELAKAQPQVGPDTGKWGQQVINRAKVKPPINTATVEELCPVTPDFSFTVPDNTGDTLGFGEVQHDITSISGKGYASTNTFCLTVEFVGPVDPADAGTGQEVVGFIEFDTDENLTTGFSGNVDFFCSGQTGIGIETTLDMFSVAGGFATLFPSSELVPVIFNGNSFTAAIPLSALGGDSAFNFAKVLGTIAEPADCAPPEGSIHSPDGTIVIPPTIGAISGRVVDSETGDPLRGDAPPFSAAELRRCSDSECFGFDVVSSQSTDSEGRFLFNSNFEGNPLIVGTYQVAAFAEQFQRGQTSPFEVVEGEDMDLADIPLKPALLQLLDVTPCDELSPLGGTCEYSVRIRNNSNTTLRGRAWSLVDGLDLGSFIGFSVFQTGMLGAHDPQLNRVGIAPGKSQVQKFKFEVPGTVANGAFICARAFVGQNFTPVFNTVAERFLFCVSKGTTGFSLVPENKARDMMLQKLGWKTPARKH